MGTGNARNGAGAQDNLAQARKAYACQRPAGLLPPPAGGAAIDDPRSMNVADGHAEVIGRCGHGIGKEVGTLVECDGHAIGL